MINEICQWIFIFVCAYKLGAIDSDRAHYAKWSKTVSEILDRQTYPPISE